MPNGATRALIDCIKTSARDGALSEGLAALYSYESQIPAVAAAKIDGLAKWYSISAPRDIAFFDVHMTADVNHSATSRMLLERLCDDDAKSVAACDASARTLDALYGFLDSVTAN
jgi:pyrroloquinoline-quinone synthase